MVRLFNTDTALLRLTQSGACQAAGAADNPYGLYGLQRCGFVFILRYPTILFLQTAGRMRRLFGMPVGVCQQRQSDNGFMRYAVCKIGKRRYG
ncbi:hypothetical protein D0T90_03935 [Neisseria animalis]|uniref:Uncharacterized protein n=1 Tax=Neisseria animalis TaxID=492 RepID=A0A5P3MQ90_NEIAN|nr:hypothetical protein D0T90_03935 [Neisseria animalis]ROW32898.1 hypothetical protein CGZ60_03550 [Neisseria animalis]